MAFEIPIQITGAAKAAIAGVVGELAAAEGKGKSAGDAISRGLREGSVAADKLKSSVGGLGGQLQMMSTSIQGFGAAFGGMTTGIRDVVSAVQSVGEGLASWTLGIIRADEGLMKLQNRLATISSSKYGGAILLGQVSGLADKTYTDVNTTTDVFIRLKNATEELGFSEQRALRLTETITKSFQLQGKSAGETSSAMLQLSQAFSSGRLQGDEFRSLSENMPSVLTEVAKSMGVTRGELKKLSSEGAITSDILAKAIESSADRTDKAFGKIQTSWQQRMQPVLNEMTTNKNFTADNFNNPLSMATNAGAGGVIGDLGLGKFIGGDAGAALDSLGTQAGNASKEVTGFNRIIAEATSFTKDLAAQLGGTTEATMSWEQSLIEIDKQFRKIHEMNAFGPGVVQQVYDFNAALATVAGTASAIAHVLDKDIWGDSKIVSTMKMFGVDLTKPKPKYSGGPRKAKTDPWQQTGNETLGDIDAALVGAREFFKMNAELNQPSNGPDILRRSTMADVLTEIVGKAPEAIDLTAKWNNELARQQLQILPPIQKGWDAVLHQATDVAGAMENAMVNAYKGMEDALVSFVTTGKFSWKSMVNSMLADMTRVLARQGLASLVGMLGGGGGGLTPSYFTGRRGFATGGSFTVGGSGGTDTTPVAFMATKGEQVTVTTPEQQKSGGGGPKHVTVVLNRDQDEAELGDIILRVIEQNTPYLRSRLR